MVMTLVSFLDRGDTTLVLLLALKKFESPTTMHMVAQQFHSWQSRSLFISCIITSKDHERLA